MWRRLKEDRELARIFGQCLGTLETQPGFLKGPVRSDKKISSHCAGKAQHRAA